jgi:hypothetical protein
MWEYGVEIFFEAVAEIKDFNAVGPRYITTVEVCWIGPETPVEERCPGTWTPPIP